MPIELLLRLFFVQQSAFLFLTSTLNTENGIQEAMKELNTPLWPSSWDLFPPKTVDNHTAFYCAGLAYEDTSPHIGAELQSSGVKLELPQHSST